MVHGEESSRRTTLSDFLLSGPRLTLLPNFQVHPLARTLPSSETCLIKSPCLPGNPTLYPWRLLSSLPFPLSQQYISWSLGPSGQTLIPKPLQSSLLWHPARWSLGWWCSLWTKLHPGLPDSSCSPDCPYTWLYHTHILLPQNKPSFLNSPSSPLKKNKIVSQTASYLEASSPTLILIIHTTVTNGIHPLPSPSPPQGGHPWKSVIKREAIVRLCASSWLGP